MFLSVDSLTSKYIMYIFTTFNLIFTFGRCLVLQSFT